MGLSAALSLLTIGLAPAMAAETPLEAGGPRAAIKPLLELTSTCIEVSGVAIIVAGALASSLYFIYSGLFGSGWPGAFHVYRANLGRGILLGLELLVAADIIGTVAVTPSIDNLIILGLIVLIRTFLSFSLEVEIEGRWPWRRAEEQQGGKRLSQNSNVTRGRNTSYSAVHTATPPNCGGVVEWRNDRPGAHDRLKDEMRSRRKQRDNFLDPVGRCQKPRAIPRESKEPSTLKQRHAVALIRSPANVACP